MPIYEYRRPNGTTFEVLQSMADDPLTEDPETGVPVERVLHAPAIHFKGKGFYNTDYGTKRRNRELRESAESGADKHEAKQAEKAKESKDSSDKAPKAESKAKDSGSSKPEKKSSSSSSSKKK
ncbi:zinc ribbon domain-containing protein [Baekduia soli]|uniref:Zinc ribbon domain-containing protein n=1 Tax=Baekduia soli TaxID=496014 RepID=A0A5B8U356_9ACTN|nr:FmdB family zinc ribbon protein [Baekduia soli]QEC47477.1 zinc ribbon domain-containing protein [Baekduia soli]